MIKSAKQKIYNLLRWSEKYTKTDMVYLAHGGFWLTLGQIVSSLSGFLLAIAFANLLPQETYGTYKFILSIASLMTIPTLSGINISITQAVARGFEGSFIPAFKTKVKWGLLGGIAGLILAGYYFYSGNTTLTISFLIAAVFMPIMDPLSLYRSLYAGRKQFKIDIKYNIVITIASAAAMVSTLFLTSNIFLIIFVYFAANSLLRFIFFYVTLQKANINKKEDPSTISYGKHLSLINIIGSIANQLDKILIFHYLSAADLAIYSMAIVPIDQMKGLTGILSSLAFPKFAQKNIAETKIGLKQKIMRFSVFLVLITILYIIAAPYLYQIFFPKYLASVGLSQLFSISLTAATIIIILSSILTAQKAQKILYRYKIITSFTKIILIVTLIKLFGLTGAIIARIIFRYFSITLLSHYFKNLK
jgi:O-antigen/teichoic acid export membrane protein